MSADALRLSVYLGDAITAGPRLAGDAVMDCFAAHEVRLAALLRGIEGFGLNRRLHAPRLPDVSTDLPLVAIAVDAPERIRAALASVDRLLYRGLVTLEPVRLAVGAEAAAGLADPVASAAALTVCCAAGERVGGRPAHRAVVDLLRRAGAAGAIVLPAVDGLLRGRRGRARLFSRNADTPMLVVSVGAGDVLRACLPVVADALADPVVTVEPVAQLKHDGEALGPPPSAAAGGAAEGVWEAIGVYTRRSARVGGRALHLELTERLRRAGAAGATTILGDWGFSSDEPPHGDRLGRVASHRPTYTVYVDRPAAVAELWPLIDEATAEHGIVTSVVVPGYRERAGDAVNGRLDLG
jgi:PII-like signaling protein